MITTSVTYINIFFELNLKKMKSMRLKKVKNIRIGTQMNPQVQ